MDKNKKWWLPLAVGAGLGIISGVVIGKAFEPSKEELEKQLNEMTQQNMKEWEEEMAEIMKELEAKKDAQFLMNQYTKLNTLLTQSKEEDANQTEILKEMETIETLVMVNPKVTTEDKETFRKYLLDCESNVFKEFGSQSVDRLFRCVYVKASGKQVFNGSGQLILSNEPNRYYKAVVQNVITFERQTRNVYICRISFKLQPFAYELNQKIITLTEPPFVLTNHTNTTAQPIIKIYGTGTAEIYVNEHTVPIVKIRNCIILDYELKEAYNESEKRGTRNSDVLTDYPELLVGDNTISWDTSANITQVKIIPNWRWL